MKDDRLLDSACCHSVPQVVCFLILSYFTGLVVPVILLMARSIYQTLPKW